jgi:hypothetical protein
MGAGPNKGDLVAQGRQDLVIERVAAFRRPAVYSQVYRQNSAGAKKLHRPDWTGHRRAAMLSHRRQSL